MKAYLVSDRKGYSEYNLVVFAENRGKAIAEALGTDEFPRGDYSFTELTARRRKKLDPYYRGKIFMDWHDMDDRVAMVREANFYCNQDYVDLRECVDCQAKEWCQQYKSMKEDEEDEEWEEEVDQDGDY